MCFGVFVQVNTNSIRAHLQPVGYIIQENGCWEWVGHIDRHGYGRWSRVLAHRWVYRQAKGEIPEGMETDHLCRNRKCVNPDHLEIVTSLENKRRGFSPYSVNAKKTHCVRGHPFSGDNVAIVNGCRQCKTCIKTRHQRALFLRESDR